MWSPFRAAKDALIRKGTKQAIEPLTKQIGGFVAEQKARPLKGWTTILVNGGILAAAAFLQFLAGLDLEKDLGLSPTLAVVLLTVINGLLRAVTTTPIGKATPAILLALLGAAWLAPPAQAQDFSLRLGTACEGSAQPKCGGSLGLVIGQGETRSVSTVTTRYLSDGRFSQTYATGIERTLFTTPIASLFACGQAGVSVAGDNRSGLVAGCFGLNTKPFYSRQGFNLSLVPVGWGSNAPAESGTWDGGVSVSLQVDFKGE